MDWKLRSGNNAIQVGGMHGSLGLVVAGDHRGTYMGTRSGGVVEDVEGGRTRSVVALASTFYNFHQPTIAPCYSWRLE